MSKGQTILYAIIAISLLITGYFVGTGLARYRVPDGMTLVETSIMDSIANLAPEIIVRDTTIWRDTTIYIDRSVPVPVEVEPGINYYVDAIIDDSTHIVVKDTIRGELLSRQWKIKRAITYRDLLVPYPVIFTREKIIQSDPQFSIYGDIMSGGNKDQFLFGFEFGAMTRKNDKLGFQYLTDGAEAFYFVKYGRRINIY